MPFSPITNRAAILLLLALVSTQCAKQSVPIVPTATTKTATPSNEPIDVSGFSKEQLAQCVGGLVTVRGKFSLRGVVGPFIQFDGGAIYLQPKANYSWGKEYEGMDGREVKATARLGLEHFEPSPAQHPPDYFYFPAETPIALVK